ncbi:MAG: tRNA (N(6)-L-threonylcarbamoyladenosine(37)-C(2))-methylthiotransferase MtaB [Dehalococcoidia bacterium]|nr:tRNA (N(6)-L-threonylcarbamoyladenosine(37)-C(2))-methylthiotransferase MtaB [Dehalococcoidia bacterium]
MAGHPAVPAGVTVSLETLGCKLNLADSELLAREFTAAGYQVVSSQAGAHVYIINTCTVTHVADAKARQELRAVRRRNPRALLVATGCYPERAPGELEALPEVDLIAGNSRKAQLVQLVSGKLAERALAGESIQADLVRTVPAIAVVRSFVKIQEGCNDYCAYCIIPKTRGTSRSFDPASIISAINDRQGQGYPEVVLTGTQLGDYGIEAPGDRRYRADHRDQSTEGNPLAVLVALVLKETAIPRVRISSLQPQDITPELLSLWSDPRLCPHFHLPLQSGAAPVLRSMRRRYAPEEYVAALHRIRTMVPMAAVTTDVIVGFPGETDADFDATLGLCDAAGFAAIHAFPYSQRPGTLAVRLPGTVPAPVKRARMERILDLAKSCSLKERTRNLGRVRPVLWEGTASVPCGEGMTVWQGLTDTYFRVYTTSHEPLRSRITKTLLSCIHQDGVWGERAE